MTKTAQNNNSSVVACVFVAMGICLPSHCLATTGGIHIQIYRGSKINNSGPAESGVFSEVQPEIIYRG
jgi:hypothetical protein